MYKEKFVIKFFILFSSGFIIIRPFKDIINNNIIKLGFISFSLYIDLFCRLLYNLSISELKELFCESNSIIDSFCFSKVNRELTLRKSSYLFII